MSQALDKLEEGTASGEHEKHTDFVSKTKQRDTRPTVQIDRNARIEKLSRSFYVIVAKCLNSVNQIIQILGENLDPKRPSGNMVFLISCLIAISLDPLFFYTPLINLDLKCLRLDEKLAITATVIRSVFDLFYVIYIVFRLRNEFFLPLLTYRGGIHIKVHKNRWAIAKEYLLRFFPVDLLAILPLPQILILSIIPTTRGSEFLNAINLLKFFVFFQYVPRVVRIYPLTSSILAEATWVKAVFNLLLYMLVSHVFGALWYFFAIERMTVCWKKACVNHTECRPNSSFYCNDSRGNYRFLDGFCPIMTPNTTIFNFGIFQDALQSGIVEVSDFPQKFLHCFQWGLQNLSCFGQNLQTSTNVWENLFVILLTIFGLVLFLFLIGNMQTYLQSKTIRSEEMRLKAREIEKWMPFGKLTENLQQQVKKHQRYVWRETKGVDVESLLNNLPKDLRRNIKRELCLKLLKKVKEFEGLDETILDALCDCVRPVLYIERTYIVREGDPLDEMLFIVQGKLRIHTSKGKPKATIYSSSPQPKNKSGPKETEMECLKEGDFCGRELVAWARYIPSMSNLPTSTCTIQALTKVEAFALMADDLANVFQKYQVSIRSKVNWEQLMTEATNAARVMQSKWRQRHSTKRDPLNSMDDIASGLQMVLPQVVNIFNTLQDAGLFQRMLPSASRQIGGSEIIAEEEEKQK